MSACFNRPELISMCSCNSALKRNWSLLPSNFSCLPSDRRSKCLDW